MLIFPIIFGRKRHLIVPYLEILESNMSRNVQRSFLKNAKINKNDEFYTQLSDIVQELKHYQNHFKNKVVFCNCDDVRMSNFFQYFVLNFETLGIKKLICACYVSKDSDDAKSTPNGFWYEYTGHEKKDPTINDIKYFKGDGDFRSLESVELLKASDIVVTNPPFSLFREYIDQLMLYEKKFLVIGNINCITYKEIFKLIQENKAWLGVNLGRSISGFIVPKHYVLYGTENKIDECGNKIVSPNNCLWLTNMDNFKRHIDLPLKKCYLGNESYFPLYDNYNAINVDKTQDIPQDYDGCVGVPITFLHKFNPKQFEIIQFRKGDDGKDLAINGKCPYFRVLIRKR